MIKIYVGILIYMVGGYSIQGKENTGFSSVEVGQFKSEDECMKHVHSIRLPNSWEKSTLRFCKPHYINN